MPFSFRIFLSSVLVLLLGAGQAWAQQPSPGPDSLRADTSETRRVEIVRANSLVGAVEGGEVVRRLIGDVRLRQEQTRLQAQRATQYTARDEILFIGDVLIVEEGDTLTADTVRYDTRQKIGQATGRVRLTDGEVVVTGPSGRYFADEKRAEFREGVTLVDSASVLTSREGQYFTDEERAEFYHDVRLTDDRTLLEADSVTYFREKEISLSRGNVFIERLGGEEADTAQADTTTRTFLFGQQAYNDNQKNYSRVTGRALLVQLRADSASAVPDTLLMRAHRMETSRQDSLRRLIATDSVRIWQQDLAAVADSAVYDQIRREDRPDSEETRLFHDPVAWTRQAQLTGDTIRVTGRDRSVDSLFAHQNAFVAQRDTVLDRIQQLKGRRLTGLFEEDSLRQLTVGPNAEAIRFLADDQDQPNGVVKASSDYITFWVRGGELRRVKFVGGVQGVQYPQESIPEPLELQGFRWLPERRPTRAALLDDERVRRRLQERAFEPEAPPALPAEARPNAGDDEETRGAQ